MLTNAYSLYDWQDIKVHPPFQCCIVPPDSSAALPAWGRAQVGILPKES